MEIEDTQPLVQEKRPKTILLESWVWFAVAALTCFTISDYVLSMFGDLGVKLVFYYNAGPILACTVFYAGRHQGLISKSERSLFWTDDGQLDKKTVALAMVSFVFIAILPLLNYNFTLAHKANLNIGLVLSVHASQTFFVALADFLIFGIILRQSQIVGMLIILIGAFVINMQHYAGADEEVILEGRLPVYVPMLFAFVVSWFQAGYILVIKTIAQRVNISDFTFFSYFVSSSFYLTTALIYWNTHEGSFSPYFLKIGMFGSIIQVCGGVSLNLAISKAKAAGPAIAVVSCSMIMLTILASLLDGTIPSLMQNLGLLLGVTGALILVIPDHLKRLFKQ